MDWWLHWQVTSGLSNTAGGLPHCSLDLCISGKSSYWGCNASWACAAAPTAGAKGFLDRVIITLGNGPLFFSSFDSCCFWYALDNRRLLAFKVLQWTTGGLNNNCFHIRPSLIPKKSKLLFRDIFVSIYSTCAFLSTGNLMYAVNSKVAFWFAFLLSFPMKYMLYRNPILKIWFLLSPFCRNYIPWMLQIILDL